MTSVRARLGASAGSAASADDSTDSRIAPLVCQSQDVVVSACVNVLEIPALSYRPRLGLYNRCSSARRAPRNASSPRLGSW